MNCIEFSHFFHCGGGGGGPRQEVSQGSGSRQKVGVEL